MTVLFTCLFSCTQITSVLPRLVQTVPKEHVQVRGEVRIRLFMQDRQFAAEVHVEHPLMAVQGWQVEEPLASTI